MNKKVTPNLGWKQQCLASSAGQFRQPVTFLFRAIGKGLFPFDLILYYTSFESIITVKFTKSALNSHKANLAGNLIQYCLLTIIVNFE